MAVQLSEDQKAAHDKMWAAMARGSRVITQAGEGGTGKTTSLLHFVGRLKREGRKVALLAPTWCAAARLRQTVGRHHGIPATSIHGHLYEPPEEADGNIGAGHRLSFTQTRDYDHDAVVVDEAGMVNEKVLRDLLKASTKKAPIFGSGDDGQLPPVKGKPGFPLDHPTARLMEIHRQAEGNPILTLGRVIRKWKIPQGHVVAQAARDHGVQTAHAGLGDIAGVLARNHGGDRAAGFIGAGCDVAIVTMNKTRLRINHQVRERLGYRSFASGRPSAGERVMAIQTNRHLRIGNGEAGVIQSVGPGPDLAGIPTVAIKVLFDGMHKPVSGFMLQSAWASHGALVDAMQHYNVPGAELREMGQPSREIMNRLRKPVGAPETVEALNNVYQRLLVLTPAYAVTTWKMQGQETPGALVVGEYVGWMKNDAWKVWYTAVTRARERCVIVTPKGF